MTTPTPSPFSGPDQAGWAQPSPPMVPPGYTPSPPGYVAPPVPVQQAAPVAADPDRPTSMWLTLEGAAGTQIAIYELDKNRPVLVIDGVRAARDINGYFKVPMANGKSEKLKVRAAVPGYPTLKFRGQTIYKAPNPSPMVRFGYLVPAIGAALFGGGWFGGIGAVLCAVGAGYGAAAWVRNSEKKTVPYIVLIAGGILLAALGIVGFVVRVKGLD